MSKNTIILKACLGEIHICLYGVKDSTTTTRLFFVHGKKGKCLQNSSKFVLDLYCTGKCWKYLWGFILVQASGKLFVWFIWYCDIYRPSYQTMKISGHNTPSRQATMFYNLCRQLQYDAQGTEHAAVRRRRNISCPQILSISGENNTGTLLRSV